MARSIFLTKLIRVQASKYERGIIVSDWFGVYSYFMLFKKLIFFSKNANFALIREI